MKEGVTSFDLRVLLGELSELQGAYLDKVYQTDSSFILRLNIPREGKREVFIEPGKWIFLGEGFDKPSEPPAFVQTLRKALGNAVLKEVRQRGFDRILLLEFEKEAQYTLILEMFGKGNLILLREDEIIHVLRPGKWKAREIKRGQPYIFPPEGVNPLQLDLEGFREVLQSRKGAVVRTLASGLNLGGIYAEELCLRAGIQKDVTVGHLGEEQIVAIYEELQGLFDAMKEPAPVVVFEEGPIDVIPFPLRSYEGLQTKEFERMSAALEEYVKSAREEPPRDEDVERVERRIRKQEEVLKELNEEVMTAGRVADYLYAHYQEVDKLLRMAREGGLREGVDPESGVLRLAVEDWEEKLEYDLGVDENARHFYEKKKTLLDRMKKVERALEESRRELKRVQSAGKREKEVRPSYKPSKKFWFDAYRWSLSRNGFLILGGRDARSNEKLVKKHLEAGDRYIHADLPGASSVILKRGSEAGDVDLEEACRFALVFSKAWQLGLGSSSAYWVTPEQVSKTAESGEYLRTGSFVVRGKRNYIHRLGLELGIGEVEYEGTKRIIASDPGALEAHSEVYVILHPGGRIGHRQLVQRLSDSFRVPPDEIQRLLPSGSFEVVKVKGIALEEMAG